MFHFLILFVPLIVNANVTANITSPVETQFNEANKLYGQGKFSEAAGAYEKMIQAGSVSTALYFNLGDAYFKSSQIGRAIAAYRQASQITPRDPDVRANLQFARNQVTGPTMLASRWDRWLARLSLNEWTYLMVAAFWLLFLSLAARHLRPRWRNNMLIYGAAGALVVFGAAFGAMLSMHHEQLAVVVGRETAVHNGPFEESPSTFTANDGAELQILDQKDDWFQVTDGRGRIGWLKRENVAVVPKA